MYIRFLLVCCLLRVCLMSSWRYIETDPIQRTNEFFGSYFGENQYPGTRIEAVMSTNDESIFIFGGRGLDANGEEKRLNDFWEFSIADSMWTFIDFSEGTQNQTVGGNWGVFGKTFDEISFPSSRSRCRCFPKYKQSFLMFGGYGVGREIDGPSTYPRGDLWEFNMEKRKWRYIQTYFETDVQSTGRFDGTFGEEFSKEIYPGTRMYAPCVVVGDSLFIHGGKRGQTEHLSDLWQYKIDSKEWKWINTNGTIVLDKLYNLHASYGEEFSREYFPGSRFGHCMWSTDFSLFIFGGSQGGWMKGDLWEFNIELEMWRWVNTNNSTKQMEDGYLGEYGVGFSSEFYPTTRFYSATVQFESFFLFGGSQNDILLDMWEYYHEEKQWRYISSDFEMQKKSNIHGLYNTEFSNFAYPGSRFGLSMVFSLDSIYLFGGKGESATGDAGDLWQYRMTEFRCFNIPYYLERNVCGSHGICVEEDYCDCEVNYIGEDCKEFSCFLVGKDDQEVCSSHGKCLSHNECDCSLDYISNDCSVTSCFDVLSNSSEVCSKNGKCVGKNVCVCKFGISGNGCQYKNVFLTNLGIIIPSILGGTFVAIIIVVIFIFVIILTVKFASRLKKYSGIDLLDVEILLEEKSAVERGDVQFKVTKSMFEVEFQDIKIISMLGAGGSDCTVYKAEWKGRTTAFKMWNINGFSGQVDIDQFEKEINILSSVSHPSLIEFYGGTIKIPKIGILMKFAEKGDLTCFLTNYTEINKRKYPIREKHDRRIVHRDLKNNNVVITELEESKIMDFGLSRVITDDSIKTKRIGTDQFMAPELTLGNDYDNKVDIFSFGIIMYCTLCDNFSPYGKVRNVELQVAQNPNFRPPIKDVDDVPDFLKILAIKSWDSNPKNRPTFSELCKGLSTKNKNVVGLSNSVSYRLQKDGSSESVKINVYDITMQVIEFESQKVFGSIPEKIMFNGKEIVSNDDFCDVKENDTLVLILNGEVESLKKELRESKQAIEDLKRTLLDLTTENISLKKLLE